MIYIVSIFLVGLSALFSGLTLGLMSLDLHELKRKVKHNNRQARKIYAVRRRGNLLLTTLLLGNVAVNAALSIYLGTIASGLVAGVIATSIIFLFGEIIPQAVISRHAMAFGSRTAWLVKILIVVLYPVAFPIAWVLDKTLGHEMPNLYSKRELLSIIEEHEDSKHSSIDKDEERIVKGALTFSEKRVSDVMTPKDVAVMVELGDVLNRSLIKKLKSSGLSRFPVYKKEKGDVVGILYLRELIGCNYQNKKVSGYYDKDVNFVRDSKPLDSLLNRFLHSKKHLFIVENDFGSVQGVISIEDVIEEIVGREIVDEFDKFADMRKASTKKRKKSKSKIRK